MNAKEFDIIVVGAGSGGLNIAGFMNRAGFSVLLIDKSDAHIGGDCLNFGCVPSKAFLHVAKTVKQAREADRFGLTVTGEVDWGTVREYIKEKQDIIRQHESAAWFTKRGMTVVLGEASFVDEKTIVVGGVQYTAKKIVLATGSRPRMLTDQGIEKVSRVINNENIFTMESLPKRVLMIGAGPISIELAQAMNYLGANVSVVDPGSQILGKEDVEVAEILKDQMQKEGVRFHLGWSLGEFTGGSEARLVNKTTGESKNVVFDAVFVGIGRMLNVEGLNLEKAGVSVDKTGRVVVNKYLRTTNKRVFVCGDLAGNYQFTHAAEIHAGVILRNFFSPFKKALNTDSISWTTFTTPEIATYGLSESELNKKGVAYQILKTNFSEDDRAITDEYQYGLSKMFIGKKGEILGGTMIAPSAGELIAELVLAQSKGLSVSALFNKTYAYPTASRINKRLVANYFSTKLNTFTKRLLKLMY